METELYTFSDVSELFYEMFYVVIYHGNLWNKFLPLRLCLKPVTDLSRIKKKDVWENGLVLRQEGDITEVFKTGIKISSSFILNLMILWYMWLNNVYSKFKHQSKSTQM